MSNGSHQARGFWAQSRSRLLDCLRRSQDCPFEATKPVNSFPKIGSYHAGGPFAKLPLRRLPVVSTNKPAVNGPLPCESLPTSLRSTATLVENSTERFNSLDLLDGKASLGDEVVRLATVGIPVPRARRGVSATSCRAVLVTEEEVERDEDFARRGRELVETEGYWFVSLL